ncbi:24211_t:CDS:2, partial [Gigaspora rosea]
AWKRIKGSIQSTRNWPWDPDDLAVGELKRNQITVKKAVKALNKGPTSKSNTGRAGLLDEYSTDWILTMEIQFKKLDLYCICITKPSCWANKIITGFGPVHAYVTILLHGTHGILHTEVTSPSNYQYNLKEEDTFDDWQSVDKFMHLYCLERGFGYQIFRNDKYPNNSSITCHKSFRCSASGTYNALKIIDQNLHHLC